MQNRVVRVIYVQSDSLRQTMAFATQTQLSGRFVCICSLYLTKPFYLGPFDCSTVNLIGTRKENGVLGLWIWGQLSGLREYQIFLSVSYHVCIYGTSEILQRFMGDLYISIFFLYKMREGSLRVFCGGFVKRGQSRGGGEIVLRDKGERDWAHGFLGPPFPCSKLTVT